MSPRRDDKRTRRRERRERVLGPERTIVATVRGVHVLSCGHEVSVLVSEPLTTSRRRCIRCLDSMAKDLNRRFEHVPEPYRPVFCEGCGALNQIVDGECRECGELSGGEPEDPVRVALLAQEYAAQEKKE